MNKNLVIVESPAKAKTIEKYLGNDFHVLSSVGHIRKDTKVDVDHDFAVTYEIDPEHKKVVTELKKAAKAADVIWLATDEDREGESISWHLAEVLRLPRDTRRITFHEITKSALKDAIQHPRTIDMNMVASQQARQTLDMLVGYDLSGIVRQKVPGAISAGRVQSPALRLIVEREREIENFDKKFNFKVTGTFAPKKTNASSNSDTPNLDNADANSSRSEQNPNKTTPEFIATLNNPQPATETAARELLESLSDVDFVVSAIDQSEGKKANPVPLTTAALQIEANSRLGFAAGTTMRAAQALYQAGLITYHRTDSLNLSQQALASIANHIEKTYGKNYLQVRHFRTKSVSAQEAHEAIRPTDITRETAGKNDYEKKLYHLIRTRTLATQMANARIAKTKITLTANRRGIVSSDEALPPSGVATYIPAGADRFTSAGGGSAGRPAYDVPTEKGGSEEKTMSHSVCFTTKGEIVIFDGFLRVYGTSKDLELPPLKQGDLVTAREILARQTFAKPPARYTEGSLVKKLEELGIGRPSTYAGIMSAIQSRGYVKKGESEGAERKVVELALINRTSSHRFPENIPQSPSEIHNDYQDESEIASSASRRTNRCKFDKADEDRSTESDANLSRVSRRITSEKSGATKGKLLPTPVGELVSDFLSEHFDQIVDYGFTAGVEEKLDLIAAAKLERIKMLRDFYTPFREKVDTSKSAARYNAARELGVDPKTKRPIFAKIGKNGGFIQLGLSEKESGEKPRFAPLPARATVKTVTYEQALEQLALPALPRDLGKAKDGTELIAASGPFGPYLKGGKYNIPIKDKDPYTITLEEAEPLYQAKIDSIIADWDDIMIINGAYGPYIKGPGRWNNLKIPKDTDPKSITKTQAEKMLAEKPKKTRRAPRRRKTSRKTSNSKTTKSAKSIKK